MNITYNKKKYIYIVIWLLIGILSFTVLEKYASAPGSHQTTIASLDEKKATVPFEAVKDGIEIESVMSKRLFFHIPKGRYSLTCYSVPAEISDLHADTYIIDAAAM